MTDLANDPSARPMAPGQTAGPKTRLDKTRLDALTIALILVGLPVGMAIGVFIALATGLIEFRC